MRFLNADPIGFSGGSNWFAYADGNPISLSDPFGLCAESVGSLWHSANQGAAVLLDTINPIGDPYKTAGWYDGSEDWYQYSKTAADIANLALAGVTMGSTSAPSLANSGGKVFWSGGTSAREAAEAFAQQTGGKTLEMTQTGRFLDAITTDKTYPFLKPAWDAASKHFANGAGVTTNVFQSASRGVRLESVWATKEYPQLLKQGTQINYHLAS
jgi:hypothetical protein